MQRREIRDAVVEADLDDLGAVADGECVERRAAVRVHPAADEHAQALVGELGHVRGGADSARTLVHGGVGDRQPGQLGDRGLVLEHDLQAALADLGLIRRVRRQELRARHQHVDDRRHVVVVHTGAQERDLVLGGHVALGEPAQLGVDGLLGLARRQGDRPAQAHALRNRVEELLDRPDADRLEHDREVLGCDCGVSGHRQSDPWYVSLSISSSACSGSESFTRTIQPAP